MPYSYTHSVWKMFAAPRYVNPFAPKSNFIPAKIQEPDYDDPDQSMIVTPSHAHKERKPKYVPGERLLKKINKSNHLKKDHEINMEQVNRSLNNIMRSF